jgi:hypothetical protein
MCVHRAFVQEVNITQGSIVIDTLVVFPGSQYYADAARFNAFVAGGSLTTAIRYDDFFVGVVDDDDNTVLVDNVQVS